MAGIRFYVVSLKFAINCSQTKKHSSQMKNEAKNLKSIKGLHILLLVSLLLAGPCLSVKKRHLNPKNKVDSKKKAYDLLKEQKLKKINEMILKEKLLKPTKIKKIGKIKLPKNTEKFKVSSKMLKMLNLSNNKKAKITKFLRNVFHAISSFMILKIILNHFNLTKVRISH